jgi:hypothetical protein
MLITQNHDVIIPVVTNSRKDLKLIAKPKPSSYFYHLTENCPHSALVFDVKLLKIRAKLGYY